MPPFENFSRVEKFEKRRKNTKAITVLLVVGILLSIVLLYLFLFGEKSEETQEEEKLNEQQSSEKDEEHFIVLDEEDKEQGRNTQNDHSEEHDDQLDDVSDVVRESLESNDNNVIEAYTANWEPIGTEQAEPHTVQFVEDSQDWIEMEQAIALATGLSEEQMVTYWIGNAGDQKAVGTVFHSDNTSEIYRVTIEWVTNEGWKPIKVEVLKELEK